MCAEEPAMSPTSKVDQNPECRSRETGGIDGKCNEELKWVYEGPDDDVSRCGPDFATPISDRKTMEC